MCTPIGASLRRNTFVMYVRRVPTQASLVMLILLHGCVTVGPDYVPPPVSAPADWSTAMPGGVSGALVDVKTLGQW
jgi:hypothetical protein